MVEYALRLPDEWSESPQKYHLGEPIPQVSLEAAQDEAQRLYALGCPRVYLMGRSNTETAWRKLRRVPVTRAICDECGTWVCHGCWGWRRPGALRHQPQRCRNCGSDEGEFKPIRHRKRNYHGTQD